MPFLIGALGPLFADIGLGGLGTALGTAAAPSALATALGTGIPIATSLGTTIAGIADQSGGPQTPTTPTTPPPSGQQLLQQRQLVGSQASNLESATSGAAGPDFLSLFAPFLAGISGQPGATGAGQAAGTQAWSPANANPQPTNPVTGNVNLSDFINTNT